MGQSIRAVLFDMDETLIVHRRSGIEQLREGYRRFAEHLDIAGEEKFMRVLWEKANDLWLMMFDGVITGDVARPYTFINTLRALRLDEALAPRMLEAFEESVTEETYPAEGAHETMDALREAGIRVGVVTNGYVSMQTRKIVKNQLEEHADFVMVSEAAGYHKPDVRIFEIAVNRAGSRPDQTLMVGDNLEADITGSVNAGLVSVLYDPAGDRRLKVGENPAFHPPHHVIDRLDAVLDLAGATQAASAAAG